MMNLKVVDKYVTQHLGTDHEQYFIKIWVSAHLQKIAYELELKKTVLNYKVRL